MNRQLARTVIGCLHVSGPLKSALHELACFARRDWAQVLHWLEISGLSLYLFDAIEKSDGWANLPTLVRDLVTKNHADNRQRAVGIEKEFVGLNRLFRNHGVKHVALKGFSKVPDYCHDITLRTQFDHDFLVGAESLQVVDLALRTAGYIPKTSHESHPRAYILSGTPTWPRDGYSNLYSSQMARSVEIHIHLWNSASEGIHFELPEDFVERAQERAWGRHTYPALCEEDALLFEVLHTFRHLLRNWCRLSLLYEMARFLNSRREDAALWRRFRQRITVVPRLSQAAGVVFALADRLFHCDIPISARPFTLNALTPPQKIWIEQYGEESAIDNFRKTKYTHFLHGEFADAFSSREAYSRQHLFPSWQRAREVISSAFRALWEPPHGLQQALYVTGRARHHICASLGYALEHARWRRLRAKSLTENEESA